MDVLVGGDDLIANIKLQDEDGDVETPCTRQIFTDPPRLSGASSGSLIQYQCYKDNEIS